MSLPIGRPRSPRRGLVLVAVLVVAASAAFIATSLLYLVQSGVAGAAGARDEAQSRLVATSGLRAIVTELNAQREVILEGEAPHLEPEYVLFEAPGEWGVVRLLPIGPGGERLVAEAGKLDLNEVDAESLVATGLVNTPLADAIVAFRDARVRPLQSVGELLAVDGMTPEILYGPVDGLAGEDVYLDVPSGADATARGLADAVTVFAVEPALQRDGRLRINLNVEWSDELARRIDDRFGEGTAGVVKGVIDGGAQLKTDADLHRTLRSLDIPVEDWPEIVDVFTTESGEYHFGRLDLNTASYEALLALPGVTPEQAAQIVETREGLDRELKATPIWPAIEGVLEPAAYERLGGRVTTRCWTWRVRIVAGLLDPEDPEGTLRHPVTMEAVVDLAGPSPRLAYLRDVSLLETAVAIATTATGPDDTLEEERLDELLAGAEPNDPSFASGGPDADDNENAGEPRFPADQGDRFGDAPGFAEVGFGDETGWPDREGFGRDAPTFDDPDPQDEDPDGEGAGEGNPEEAGDGVGPRRQRIGRWTGGGRDT